MRMSSSHQPRARRALDPAELGAISGGVTSPSRSGSSSSSSSSSGNGRNTQGSESRWTNEGIERWRNDVEPGAPRPDPRLTDTASGPGANPGANNGTSGSGWGTAAKWGGGLLAAGTGLVLLDP
jgi:hypothetical protein